MLLELYANLTSDDLNCQRSVLARLRSFMMTV